MQASVILDRVAEILQDVGGLTWTPTQLLGWLNDSQRAVVMVRPDSSAVTADLTCVAGTKQSIPATGERLLRVVRNMGADGSSPGRAIKKADRAILDENIPDWHSAAAVDDATGYVFDEVEPKTFYLTPPMNVGRHVEIVYCASPADAANSSSNIALPDLYAPSMIEWCLYRAFARDAPETPNGQRAKAHFANFFSMLGVKVQADMAVKPEIRGRNN